MARVVIRVFREVGVDQLSGGVELIRRLDGQRDDAGQRALGQGRQGTGRRQLDQRGRAEFGHRPHAQVPAHRRGDLGDNALQPLLAGGDRRAVGVREQGDARVLGAGVRGCFLERCHGRRHVPGVEGARDLERPQPHAGRRVCRQGREARERPRCHDLAGRVDVGWGEAVAGDRREHRVLVSAEHRGHPGLLHRGGLRHRPAAYADQAYRLIRGNHARDHSGGQFPDAVPGRGVGGSDVRRQTPVQAWPCACRGPGCRGRPEPGAPVPAEAWLAAPPCPASALAEIRAAATSSGWATAVSLISSAVAVVPYLMRSQPIRSDQVPSCPVTPGNSSHGARNPGDCAP